MDTATPKIIYAVIVYDRFDNLREQVRSWSMCETQNAQMVVIHNYDSQQAKESYKSFCDEMGIHYVPRDNVGFDIGAFQDVCNERLEGFPSDWDYIIWVTDDTLPMRKDFVHSFISPLQKDSSIGITAMEICESQNTRKVKAKKHIRTTGFALSKELSRSIEFPRDPVRTKEDCYAFEHRSDNILMDQMNRIGLKSVQITPIDVSPLWDQGRPAQAKRKAEHYKIFPPPSQSDKKVTFICLIYNSYPEILSSLINQTHRNWELILIHDGPETMAISKIIEAANDPRIQYIQTKERKGSWGHHWRQWALNELKENRLSKESDYICITNADNHLVPVFCEYFIKGFSKPNTVAVYCSQMVHSYIAWGIISCRLRQGYIDCSGVMIRRDVACEVGWNDTVSHSSDWLFFQDIINKYGSHRFNMVPGVLLIHN